MIPTSLLKKVWRTVQPIYRRLGGDPVVYARRFYSQEGEDMILDRLYQGQESGFYIDVGAHHPIRYSNTYHFYLRGWRGINLDAAPGSMAKFAQARNRDINLECAVGEKSGQILPFYVLSEPTLSTFDKALAESHLGGRWNWQIVETVQVRTQTLGDILAVHLPAGRAIDFMSVDVEGFDLEVLRSNDWAKYRPKIVIAECFASKAEDLAKDPVHMFLESQRYERFANTPNSYFFRDKTIPIKAISH